MLRTPPALDGYARITALEGGVVFQAGDCWWRKVRPFFYRPLLPLCELPEACPPPSWPARLGGFQFLTPPSAAHNSTMAFLVFPDASAYALARLPHSRRWEVKFAQRHYAVRPLLDLAEFQHQAYPVYVDFYHRTRYGYFSRRLNRDVFHRWVEALFAPGDALIRGAFAADRLQAVSIARAIAGTVYYHTFFCHTEALPGHVASLLLHHVREEAAHLPGITQVFAGMKKYGAGASVDSFYLHRGAQVVRRPAVLRLSPLSRLLLRGASPHLLRQLVGEPA